jgi:hypothetical protein
MNRMPRYSSLTDVRNPTFLSSKDQHLFGVCSCVVLSDAKIIFTANGDNDFLKLSHKYCDLCLGSGILPIPPRELY